MKKGDEVIYTRTRSYRGVPAQVTRAIVIGHTRTRIRLQAGAWKGTVSYRHVEPIPAAALFVIDSKRSEISDATRKAALEITFRYPERIEIGEISFSERPQ